MRWLKLSMAALLAMPLAGCKQPDNVIPPEAAIASADASPARETATDPAAISTQPSAMTSPSAGPVDIDSSELLPDGPVMALVNGKPISMKTLHEILVRDHGMNIAYQLIANELVSQEAASKKITVSKEEVARETDAVLKRAIGELPAANQREKVLEEVMNRVGASPEMWDMLMKRQSLLRKIVEPDVKVADEELKDEFGVQYDRKITVRDIQVPSVGDAEKALNTLRSQGDKITEELFSDTAKKVSTGVTAATGGLLSPITAKSMYPPALRDAALRFKKPLEMSGIIQCGTTFHILMCSKIEEPVNVKFEDVKPKLLEAVRERHIAELQQQHLGELIKNARKSGKIEFINPTLKAQDAQPPAPGQQ